MEKEILFTEVQKFRQWWLWLILILAGVPTGGILIYQLITGHPVGNSPASNTSLLIITVFLAAPLLLGFYFIKLFTVIDTESIYYGFGIGKSNLTEIHLADITEMKVIGYKSTGLGMRVSNEFGTIYNTSWGMGLFIVNNKGSKMLIGTKQPEQMNIALSKMKKNL